MGKKKDVPKVVWCALVNLRGLSTFVGYWNAELREWYDETGNFCVSKLGCDACNSDIVTFASADKKEWALWVQGACTVLEQIRHWAETVPDPKRARKEKVVG